MRVLCVALLAAACTTDAGFVCQDSTQCVAAGQAGFCERTSYCSFPDTSCSSGRRYGDYASNGLRDKCVLDGETPDAGVPDAPFAQPDSPVAQPDAPVSRPDAPIAQPDAKPALPDAKPATPDAPAAVYPAVRVIARAYYSDYSGTTYSTTGMSHDGFSIPTSGVVDGDLLIFVANVDNGSDTLWPDPIAPGFSQLVQKEFGNDGQTFVVQTKIANQEPATYSGLYGSGKGSSSATIALLAVSNAQGIDDWDFNSPGVADMTPPVGTDMGVTTTHAHDLLIYCGGVDWNATPGSNTFVPPSGYTTLVSFADRGDQTWDWTTEAIAWNTQASAGATGAVSATFSSSSPGTTWSVLLAIDP